MRNTRTAALVCLGSALAPAPVRSTFAMQFEAVAIAANEMIVGGRGPIVKGDATRLEQALAAISQSQQVLALALDSPGGNVSEGELLTADSAALGRGAGRAAQALAPRAGR